MKHFLEESSSAVEGLKEVGQNEKLFAGCGGPVGRSGGLRCGAGIGAAGAIAGTVVDAFRFSNPGPFAYHLTVSARGFQPHSQDVNVSGTVPVTISVTFQVASSTTTLNVMETAGEVGSVPTVHTA